MNKAVATTSAANKAVSIDTDDDKADSVCGTSTTGLTNFMSDG